MKILPRYVIREHVGPLIFSLSALTILLLLNQVAKQFGQLVGKGLSWGIIGEFFLLSIPFIVAMTLPMAVLVAVLYGFSRLVAENEVTALRASGVSVNKIVAPVMAGGVVLALLMLLFNDQVLPRANHRLRTLQTDIARKKPTFALREQVINEVIPGRIFLKAGHIDDATNRMREVFIYNFEDPAHRKTIYADSGVMGLTTDESTLEMTLHHGFVLQVPNDDPSSLQRLYFTTDVVRVRGVTNKFEKTEKDDYRGEREMTVCQMNQEYQTGVYQLELARSELASTLGNSARYAATGQRPPVGVLPSRKAQRTSGALYCDLIRGALGAVGVPSAEAAETPGVQQGVAGANPGAAQHGAPQSAAKRAPPKSASTLGGLHPLVTTPGQRPASVPVRPRFGMQPAPSVTPAQIEVIRSRMTDASITIARYQVEIQKKFALAAACVVFVLFGAPIALRFPRGGVGVVIVVSVIAFGIYYVCLIGGEALADKLLLSPFWAMWAANAIFGVIGAIMLVRSQRVGAMAATRDTTELVERARLWIRRRAERLNIRVGRRAA
ncbi:MAG TPA: LptF/LptG family permease [Gemmatimonadaceae bacterium]|nr:LptF/LptG family permease [Gemmatimonadaceae bacterium]